MNAVLRRAKVLLKNITVLDLVVGVSIVAVILFFLIYFPKKSAWTTIEIKLRSPYTSFSPNEQLAGAPYFWQTATIKPGDAQLDSSGQQIAVVESVHGWGDITTETWVTIKIRTNTDKSSVLQFNYQNVFIGSTIKLQISNYTLEGIVTRIGGVDNRPKEEKVIKARLIDPNNKNYETFGVSPWVAAAPHAGDKMVAPDGDTIAEIQSVDVQDADRTVVTSDGRVLVQKDPLRKDVYLTVKLATAKTDHINYFLDDYPVKIDAEIPLYFPTYKIIPRITDIL